jgi:hypothetical protein
MRPEHLLFVAAEAREVCAREGVAVVGCPEPVDDGWEGRPVVRELAPALIYELPVELGD